MEVKAKLRYLRMSPRKVRLLADLIRGKSAQSALDQLQFAGKAAAMPVSKLVKSAIANATNNFGLDLNNLFVKEIFVDQGPTLKRSMPRAQGRATPIMKRTSHVSITLAEVKDSGIREGKKTELVAPVKLSGTPVEDEGIKLESKKAGLEDVKDVINKEQFKSEGGASKKGFTKKTFNRKAG